MGIDDILQRAEREDNARRDAAWSAYWALLGASGQKELGETERSELVAAARLLGRIASLRADAATAARAMQAKQQLARIEKLDLLATKSAMDVDGATLQTAYDVFMRPYVPKMQSLQQRRQAWELDRASLAAANGEIDRFESMLSAGPDTTDNSNI